MNILRNTAILILSFQTAAFCADLSLQEVLDKSRTYWASRLGESQVEAEASSRLAKSAFLPNIQSTFTMGKDYIADPSQKLQGTGDVSLNQQLLNISDWLTVGARNADAVAQACQTESDQIDISKNVITLFFNVLGNMDEDRLQTKRASRIEKAVNLLRETTKLRLSAESDLYLAETQVFQIDIQRAQITADKIAALNQLRSQLGISPKEPLTLDNKFIDQAADITNWNQWSENIPSILALKSKVEATSRDISATQWELFPAVGVAVTYSDPVSGQPGADDSLSVLGTASIPIFDQSSRQIRAKRAKRLYSIFQNLLQTKKNQVTNEIASLIIQKKSDQIALEQATKQMEISEKAYKGAWTLLSLGKNDYFNIQNAQDVAINAERQWLQIKRRLDATNATLQILQDAVNRVKSSKYSCVSISN